MMTLEGKLYGLIARRNAIIARGKYKKCPGALKKVERQIKKIELQEATNKLVYIYQNM